MKPLPCTFTLDGRPAGRGTLAHSREILPAKDAYFCTKCARVWLIMTPQPNSGYFIPHCVACAECGGGSLLNSHPGDLSYELMLREFTLSPKPRNYPHAP